MSTRGAEVFWEGGEVGRKDQAQGSSWRRVSEDQFWGLEPEGKKAKEEVRMRYETITGEADGKAGCRDVG